MFNNPLIFFLKRCDSIFVSLSKYGMVSSLQAILVLTLLFAASACEKENTETEKSKTLTQGVWKVIQAGIDSNMNNQLSQNEIDTMRACERDNTWDFRTGGRLIINDLGVPCDITSITHHSWNLLENETYLEIKNHAGPFTLFVGYRILELSPDKMVLADEGSPQAIFEWGR
jgi:hypothetical protein